MGHKSVERCGPWVASSNCSVSSGWVAWVAVSPGSEACVQAIHLAIQAVQADLLLHCEAEWWSFSFLFQVSSEIFPKIKPKFVDVNAWKKN